MKITTLIENKNTGHEELIAEFGLSLLIETHGKRILFDTGSTGAFLKNAAAMNISLSNLDAVIVSHAHFDHSGGVNALLQACPDVRRFVLAQDYFEHKYKLTPDGVQDIGTRFEREDIDRAKADILWVDATTALTQGVYLVKNFARETAYEHPNPDFVQKRQGAYKMDLFWDEIALAVQTKRGIVVVAGCSHCGVVNLVRTVVATLDKKIYAVVGGAHLTEASKDRVEQTAKELKEMGIKRCWLNHCTGQPAAEQLAWEFGCQYQPFHTGDVIEIPE